MDAGVADSVPPPIEKKLAIRGARRHGYGDGDGTSSGGDAVSVHRIRIQADRGGDPVAVDLALPSATPVGELLPAIVALVEAPTAPDAVVRGWRLDRITGGPLSESLSLRDNAIHDGDLLILAPEHAPPLGLMRLEPCREVAATRLASPVTGAPLPGMAGILAAVLAAVVLAWSGVAGHSAANLIVAAIGACAAAAAAFTTGHPTVPGVAAVALAAATGFLAVPSGPAAPNVFLAAAAAFAATLVVQRLSELPSPAWSATASLAVLVALGTVVAMPVAMVGAVLSTASLGLLTLAPRIAVLAAGLGPDHWTDEMAERAAVGHATLTGLAAGCATGAASGATLVAVAGLRSGAAPGGAVVFSALVGLVLLLRARTYVEPFRQILLATAGLVSGTSSLVAAVATYPDHVAWVGGVLIAIALVAGRRPQLGTAASRLADRLEYAALAAVIPVALWVGGVYTLVGEGRLS